MPDPTLVNAVGGGDLGQELPLGEIKDQITGEEVRYDPEYWPGLYIRLVEDSPAIFLFRTGKYNIAGADSVDELLEAKRKIHSILKELGHVKDINNSFEIRNLVFVDEYDKNINLETISLELGLEYTEYDPEQFPGVVYSASKFKGTFIIFESGKVVYTGSDDTDDVEDAFESLFELFDTLFSDAE